MISGEREGGVAGFAKGGAKVDLVEREGSTLLSYRVDAQIGGKLVNRNLAAMLILNFKGYALSASGVSISL
jgi:carbon monoxide dehydrogenase subunit G